VNNLKSSPSPTSGYNFPSAAKKPWDGMLKADSCLPENFNVQNGVLGLHQYVYLNIIHLSFFAYSLYVTAYMSYFFSLSFLFL
jgi:hypothetical protein